MFGKRTGQPGQAAVTPRPAPEAAPVAQPTPGVQVEAFAFGGEPDANQLQAAARKAESYAAKPASPAADRLDALAARPRPEPEIAPARNAPGPKATPGFEQLKKAQAVAEIVREQSDYYHATKTTIFNALMNTIDLAQLAQLDTKAASEEIRDIVAELVAIKNVSMSVAEQEHLVQDI
ncbi:MAG: CpaF family protein, partial [Alphaproteobacteria bacterium]|nr:CpaF family protein [Alphaproteobacteria bacterium]